MTDGPPDALSIAIAQLNPVLGDIAGNLELARAAHAEAAKMGADLLVLTELFLCGYPPEDLVLKPAVQAACREAAEALARDTATGPGIVVGAPWVDEDGLHNSVLLLDGGRIAAIRHKVELPNYGVFDELRVFKPGPLPGPVDFRGVRIGLPICEDIWRSEVTECLTETGAELLIVPNGSPYWSDKAEQRTQVAVARVVETGLPLLFANQLGGQDELVFDGGVVRVERRPHARFPDAAVRDGDRADAMGARGGGLALHAKARWRNCLSRIAPTGRPACSGCATMSRRTASRASCSAFRAASIPRLRRQWRSMRSGRNGCAPSCCPTATPRPRALATPKIAPGASASNTTVLPIAPAVEGVGDVLDPLFANLPRDITEENIQSRIRGVALMAISNKLGLMLVTTGNKSEVSVGYATIYGDMNGGFNPIKDLYKTEVYRLARFRNRERPAGCLGPAGEVIPASIIDKAPTAELRENQKDQDLLPPYDVLDAILEGLVEKEMTVAEIVALGHDRATVKRVEQLLYLSEYKRRQAAPGVKITMQEFRPRPPLSDHQPLPRQ